MGYTYSFTEGSGLQDSVYGKCQAPIRMFIEKAGEEAEKNSVIKDLFLMGTSENYGDMFTTMTAMTGFKPVGENGTYPEDKMQEGFQKLLVYDTWKDSFCISKEMIEDSKIMDLKRQPAAFMTSYTRTRELLGACLFGSAMSGAATITWRSKSFDLKGADNVTLFNTEHPSKLTSVTAKQSNKFSNTFSASALGKIEAAMHLFEGDNENILDVAPDTILIPDDAAMKEAVFAAIGADKDPVTSNNAFNYQYGRWNVIVWPYLNKFLTVSGDAPYVILDSKYNQTYGGAVWNDRVSLDIRSTIDDDTDANIWRGRSRFNACFNDWRFAAVGGVTGGTAL